ncbi:transcriptional regulator, tetr family [hydrocarbon metagenome]|uniref:Transcriptional regulator, tetr family n=1 Tax=hydrocarbon metagenome TaxID=938273 RepID=A0A0W8E7H1_9ZZZZ
MPKETFFNLPESKRTRIIDAAIDEFSKSHYSNVTIDNIVKNAEIPKGSFYQYFQNKDDLYVYLFTELGDTKIALFEQLKSEIQKISFREYMMKYIVELKKLEGSGTRMVQLKQEFLNQCPQEIKKQILREEMPKSIKLFDEVIDAYIKKGEFRKDLDSKSAAYVTVMSLSNLEYYPFCEEEAILAVLMNVIDFLIRGMEGNVVVDR